MFPSAKKLFSNNTNCIYNCRLKGTNCNCKNKNNSSNQFILLHDNSQIHKADSIKKYLKNKKQKVLDFPDLLTWMQSQNLWKILDDETKDRNPKDLNDLFGILEKAWNVLPMETLEHLVLSMPRRLEAVIKNNGGPTKYWPNRERQRNKCFTH